MMDSDSAKQAPFLQNNNYHHQPLPPQSPSYPSATPPVVSFPPPTPPSSLPRNNNASNNNNNVPYTPNMYMPAPSYQPGYVNPPTLPPPPPGYYYAPIYQTPNNGNNSNNSNNNNQQQAQPPSPLILQAPKTYGTIGYNESEFWPVDKDEKKRVKRLSRFIACASCSFCFLFFLFLLMSPSSPPPNTHQPNGPCPGGTYPFRCYADPCAANPCQLGCTTDYCKGCSPVCECKNNTHCPNSQYCLAGRCAAYQQVGEVCGGSSSPAASLTCVPNLICNVQPGSSNGASGVCRPACNDKSCSADQYCSRTSQMCLQHGFCSSVKDCEAKENQYSIAQCRAPLICESGQCSRRCVK